MAPVDPWSRCSEFQYFWERPHAHDRSVQSQQRTKRKLPPLSNQLLRWASCNPSTTQCALSHRHTPVHPSTGPSRRCVGISGGCQFSIALPLQTQERKGRQPPQREPPNPSKGSWVRQPTNITHVRCMVRLQQCADHPPIGCLVLVVEVNSPPFLPPPHSGW